MLVFWGPKWCKSPKCKVLWLFSVTTSFKICIFSMFALIARRSKYDFWIPDGILTLEIKNNKTFFFSRYQIFWIEKKVRRFLWIKLFFLTQNRNFRNFDFSSKMSILDEDFFWSKKSPNCFFDPTNLISRKNMFFWIFISRVKIPPGIQKSYLERRAISASMLKTSI